MRVQRCVSQHVAKQLLVVAILGIVALVTAQDPPLPVLVTLRELQGSGDESPYEGQVVRL